MESRTVTQILKANVFCVKNYYINHHQGFKPSSARNKERSEGHNNPHKIRWLCLGDTLLKVFFKFYEKNT